MTGTDADRASYEALMRELAGLSATADAQRAEAHTWYEQQCAAAQRAVRTAEEQVRHAEVEFATAAEQVERVDAEAAHLWQVLRGRLGTRRLNDPPVPVAEATGDPVGLLDGVRELLDRARRPGELPSSVNPLLVTCGVLAAAAAYALGVAARAFGASHGGELAVGMPVLALVVTLLGPVAGLGPAKLIADRRHAVLGPRPMAVVVIAGAVTTTALLVLLR